jgi:hypothetical protein
MSGLKQVLNELDSIKAQLNTAMAENSYMFKTIITRLNDLEVKDSFELELMGDSEEPIDVLMLLPSGKSRVLIKSEKKAVRDSYLKPDDELDASSIKQYKAKFALIFNERQFINDLVYLRNSGYISVSLCKILQDKYPHIITSDQVTDICLMVLRRFNVITVKKGKYVIRDQHTSNLIPTYIV